MTTLTVGPADVDFRAADALTSSDPRLAGIWADLQALTRCDDPPMGLSVGDRPAADVDVLAGAIAMVEFELARRMHAATIAGCLPLAGQGAMLSARGWDVPWARRLARCAALADAHDGLTTPWAAGIITSNHVDAVARHAECFTAEELSAVIVELVPHWGVWSPAAIERFVRAAARMLHPPSDPEPAEADAYETRNLSFALLRDSVIVSGELPRVEGELVIAAIDAFAERLRTSADHVPASARRADALIELVNAAHACDALPTRGGLPVALNVTLDHTALGDPIWSTGRGHTLTESEGRWASCDAAITPIVVASAGCPGHPFHSPDESTVDAGRDPSEFQPLHPGTAARVAALAALMLGPTEPLAVGRTMRTATPAQRRALARRDGGCIIPGCQVPAEACQTHHLIEWAAGGSTDLPELALLCWAHHRQVDLRMWTIDRGRPSDSADPPSRDTRWPANNGAPFTITRTPRSRWRT